jgi:hypothetical protein
MENEDVRANGHGLGKLIVAETPSILHALAHVRWSSACTRRLDIP